VSDVLAQSPGVEIITGRVGHVWIASSRGIEAIEYYAGASEIPAKYVRLNATCAVVVIHTRR
jgi:hypothetical protein